MKKFATALALMSMTLFTSTAHADVHKYKMKGSASKESTDMVFDMAWPVAVGTLAVIVTVATLAATSSTNRSPTFPQN